MTHDTILRRNFSKVLTLVLVFCRCWWYSVTCVWLNLYYLIILVLATTRLFCPSAQSEQKITKIHLQLQTVIYIMSLTSSDHDWPTLAMRHETVTEGDSTTLENTGKLNRKLRLFWLISDVQLLFILQCWHAPHHLTTPQRICWKKLNGKTFQS